MNFIYDIYLNLNMTLYDFYDWNKTDKIIHIKKIPIFVISDKKLKAMITHDIKIDMNILNSIKDKTETWSINSRIKYCALFSSTDDIIAIEFDKTGKSIKKSFLCIDEANDILEDINEADISNIQFTPTKKTQNILKTRKQIYVDNFINNELKDIDTERLKYICFECLGNSNNNIKDLKKLRTSNTKYKNLYDILKLTSKGTK